MFKKFISLLLTVLLAVSAAILFTSCTEQAEYPVKIGKLTIAKEPKNIVILDKNLADIISAIGYDVKMVGRSDEVNHKGLSVVPSMGTAHDPSVEKIKKAKADIVFAGALINEADKKALEESEIAVVQFTEANTMKQLSTLYKKIGSILGGNRTGAAKAKKAFKEIKSTLQDVQTAAKRDKTISTVVYLYIDNGVLKTVNDGTWCSTLLSYTGSMNAFGKASSDVVDLNKLLLADPDNIFVSSEEVEQFMNDSDNLRSLSALSGNTFIIPYDELKLQGYTTLDVIEEMINDITGRNEDD